jgi:hypothetical protein
VDFSDLVTVNQKLTFSLSSDIESSKHSCLVRKIKGSLMAVVISNRDKAKLDLSVDEDIYLFHDHKDETWISHARIAQNQSYPLVIVDLSGEPYPISGRKEDPLPAHIDEIESVENDHLVSELSDGPIVEPVDIGSMSIESVDETPENEWLAESNRAIAEQTGAEETNMADVSQSDNELIEPVDMDDVIVFDDELADIPDIDTSELEAELESDIDNSLEAAVDAPDAEESDSLDASLDGLDQIEELEYPEDVYADDSLEDMAIDHSESLDIGDVYVKDVAQTPDDSEQSVANDIQSDMDLQKQVSGESFEDFFSFEFVVVDSETAEKLEGVINKYSSAQRLSFDAVEEIEDLDFIESGDGDDNGLKETLKGLLTRVARVENTIERFSGKAYNNQLSFGNAISEGSSDPIRSSICLKLDTTGIEATFDGPLPDGACVLLMVNRQWKPPLLFDAVAVLLESETNESGLSTGKLRFTAIHADDASSIDDYLKHGSEYLQVLKGLTQS